jgi:hypothetical protein
MNAIIFIANQKLQLFAARTEDGEYVIFESLGPCEATIGDVVNHKDFYGTKREVYRNITSDESFEVYVHKICASLYQAKKLCLLE